ncbi:heat shock protein Hsp90 [Rickenella mellea]|uniref:Heat shock protein Hsp90 n=1 Tax=Rickenella mellea TaxID=50990 RepID=A0A4R5XE67_9AGAM|nr:heat shock protein Hsp90 [Rickenella mellea]
MRILPSFLLSLTLFSSVAFAEQVPLEAPSGVPKQKHDYQSDVARLRKIVINSLYSHRDVFLRELISNANDALEKLRLTALKDKTVWDGEETLNITIKSEKNENGKGGRIIIADTGIGMTAEELTNNLGTLAKSGTTEFLQRAESSDATGTGNLIGAFGLGFYSSFLVADRVYVSSIAPKTAKNPQPAQHVFSSSAEESSFEVYPDPRGNTLGNHGTEITLVLKDDALEYLDTHTLQELVNKHSVFSSTFPIYLFTTRTEEVPEEEEMVTPEEAGEATPSEKSDAEKAKLEDDEDEDEDEAVIEELSDEKVKEKEEEKKEVKMKPVTVDEWVHLNPMPPIWLRDPKNITEEEYDLFYQATFRDFTKPIAYHHFSGDSGSGVSFKAIVFIPGTLPDSFWQQPTSITVKDVRLMVKRVFITSDLGDDSLPKWASWVKVVIDADDLPLNVSRETLQGTSFLRQIRRIILRRLIQLMERLAKEEPAKFEELQKTFGSVIKLGAIEDQGNRDKLAVLARFPTNQRNSSSLDEYLDTRKKGQKHIFYLADVGKKISELQNSVFVEKLHARGYEVFLLNEPMDEVLFQNLRMWKKLGFQDVAKAGLKFGDEDLDPEEEKEQHKELTERFRPLLDWLKKEAGDVVSNVVISNRLVTSPCAIVADVMGYTANVEKLINAANKKAGRDFMHEYAKKQKLLEINPKSPLIEGLLKRIENLPAEGEEKDLEAEEELKEVASILIDGALVRSGFEVPDSNVFFTRVDRVLRRSLGVSETAQTDATVKPAPPVEAGVPTDEVDEAQQPDTPPLGDIHFDKDGKPRVVVPDELKDKISIDIEEMPDDDTTRHDEL